MKSCKILRYGAVCGLAALAAVGCSVDDAETIRVRELTAAEHELFVPASGGTAQIQLYSNGRVRVEALNDIGGWASVDRSEFDGDRMVSVTFTENDSFRRMAKLRFVLDGGTRADTVCIKQYGVVPSLECPAPYKAIRGSVETFTQFEIDTNIPLGDFAVATAYVGPTRDWIRSVQPEQGMLVVDTKPNPGDDVCKAVVNLSYVDGWEETFSANLYITQADKDDEFGREVSFADVRALATAEGTAVDEDILIEGIVVSDFHSKNMEANPSVSYDKVDVTVNDCTAYLESPDGRYGFRLRFDTPEDNVLARGTPLALAQRHGPHARGESRTLHDQQPGRRKHGRKRCRRGDSRQAASDFGTDRRRRLHLRLARKHRISVQGGQLCQRLRKLQPFVRCQRLADGQQQPHGRLGVAADGRRGKFDLRTGQHALPLAAFGSGRPAGTGTTHGIVVHNNCRATATWGATRSTCSTSRASAWNGPGVGLYGVCRMGRQPHKYSFGTYAKFNSRYAYNRLESITPSDDISSGKTVPNAELFCENHVETTAAEAWPIAGTGNYNNPEVGSLGTSLTCKAYFVKAGVKGWYRWEGNEVVGYNGLRMEFSTASLNGSHMLLGFSFAAGTISATTSKTYPAHWCVEYSVDGGQSYTLCPSAATGADYVHLRSLPWWDASLAGNRYNTCSSAGIGLTDHLFRLPAEVFGRERVMVRIRPYDKVMTVLPLVWNGDTETAEISAATTYDNQLRWGVITLRYR
ncbi:MAG: hypothetical protein ACLVBA_16540 [Alistipes finegoldii]|uniref:hypothetical protein n=1 Tax=Alistipes finegoldii TaxID=214856 RepID=UPI00399CE79E